MKILFILKDRFYNQSKNSYGLINSSRQVAEFLETIGYECKVVQVVDYNAIDKELFQYKPDVVIIEALWVTGAKMKELIEIKRYQNIKCIVRVHSDAGFLAAETMAFKYINDYIELHKPNFYVSMNNEDFNNYAGIALDNSFLYLPNIITIKHHRKTHKNKNYMDVGCFGSLRILKNQCYQALCAMDAAERLGKTLRFHITVDVNMTNTSVLYPVLKNLEEIFEYSRHELVKHYWLDNSEFHELIREMDIGLQLSYTESFNIVAADFVVNDVPIVVSDAIGWMPSFMKTSTVEYEKTIRKIMWIYRLRKWKFLTRWSKAKLIKFNATAKLIWTNALIHL